MMELFFLPYCFFCSRFSSKLFFTHPSPSKEGKEKSPLIKGGRGVVRGIKGEGDGAGGLYQKK
jgi:hypothetical protein